MVGDMDDDMNVVDANVVDAESMMETSTREGI